MRAARVSAFGGPLRTGPANTSRSIGQGPTLPESRTASVPLPVPHAVRSAYLRVSSAIGPAPLGILIPLIAMTGAAWALTLYQALTAGTAVQAGMADPDMGGMAMVDMPAIGWSFTDLGIFVTVWTVMMAAMMLPAATPMILIFASAQARRDRHVAI